MRGFKDRTFLGFNNIGFDYIPPVGTRLENRGQVLTIRDHEQVKHHTTGEMMTLLVWTSRCAECDTPYMFRSSWAKPRLARRCIDHSFWNKRIKWGPNRTKDHTCRLIFPPDTVAPESLF